MQVRISDYLSVVLVFPYLQEQKVALELERLSNYFLYCMGFHTTAFMLCAALCSSSRETFCGSTTLDYVKLS